MKADPWLAERDRYQRRGRIFATLIVIAMVAAAWAIDWVLKFLVDDAARYSVGGLIGVAYGAVMMLWAYDCWDR